MKNTELKYSMEFEKEEINNKSKFDKFVSKSEPIFITLILLAMFFAPCIKELMS